MTTITPDPTPCPFCGSSDLEPRILGQSKSGGVTMTIQCRRCGARGPIVYTTEAFEWRTALGAWRRRPRGKTIDEMMTELGTEAQCQ